jgi:hypothetical protein
MVIGRYSIIKELSSMEVMSEVTQPTTLIYLTGKPGDRFHISSNFYLSAVDDLLRGPDDDPSIGLILCCSKVGVVKEF